MQEVAFNERALAANCLLALRANTLRGIYMHVYIVEQAIEEAFSDQGEHRKTFEAFAHQSHNT